MGGGHLEILMAFILVLVTTNVFHCKLRRRLALVLGGSANSAIKEILGAGDCEYDLRAYTSLVCYFDLPMQRLACCTSLLRDWHSWEHSFEESNSTRVMLHTRNVSLFLLLFVPSLAWLIAAKFHSDKFVQGVIQPLNSARRADTVEAARAYLEEASQFLERTGMTSGETVRENWKSVVSIDEFYARIQTAIRFMSREPNARDAIAKKYLGALDRFIATIPIPANIGLFPNYYHFSWSWTSITVVTSAGHLVLYFIGLATDE